MTHLTFSGSFCTTTVVPNSCSRHKSRLSRLLHRTPSKMGSARLNGTKSQDPRSEFWQRNTRRFSRDCPWQSQKHQITLMPAEWLSLKATLSSLCRRRHQKMKMRHSTQENETHRQCHWSLGGKAVLLCLTVCIHWTIIWTARRRHYEKTGQEGHNPICFQSARWYFRNPAGLSSVFLITKFQFISFKYKHWGWESFVLIPVKSSVLLRLSKQKVLPTFRSRTTSYGRHLSLILITDGIRTPQLQYGQSLKKSINQSASSSGGEGMSEKLVTSLSNQIRWPWTFNSPWLKPQHTCDDRHPWGSEHASKSKRSPAQPQPRLVLSPSSVTKRDFC